jgi:hypothetical protein
MIHILALQLLYIIGVNQYLNFIPCILCYGLWIPHHVFIFVEVESQLQTETLVTKDKENNVNSPPTNPEFVR